MVLHIGPRLVGIFTPPPPLRYKFWSSQDNSNNPKLQVQLYDTDVRTNHNYRKASLLKCISIQRGDNGCLLHQSPKFSNNVFLFVGFTTLGTFDWLIQTFQPLISIYRSGNFVYHQLGYTLYINISTIVLSLQITDFDTTLRSNISCVPCTYKSIEPINAFSPHFPSLPSSSSYLPGTPGILRDKTMDDKFDKHSHL